MPRLTSLVLYTLLAREVHAFASMPKGEGRTGTSTPGELLNGWQRYYDYCQDKFMSVGTAIFDTQPGLAVQSSTDFCQALAFPSTDPGDPPEAARNVWSECDKLLDETTCDHGYSTRQSDDPNVGFYFLQCFWITPTQQNADWNPDGVCRALKPWMDPDNPLLAGLPGSEVVKYNCAVASPDQCDGSGDFNGITRRDRQTFGTSETIGFDPCETDPSLDNAMKCNDKAYLVEGGNEPNTESFFWCSWKGGTCTTKGSVRCPTADERRRLSETSLDLKCIEVLQQGACENSYEKVKIGDSELDPNSYWDKNRLAMCNWNTDTSTCSRNAATTGFQLPKFCPEACEVAGQRLLDFTPNVEGRPTAADMEGAVLSGGYCQSDPARTSSGVAAQVECERYLSVNTDPPSNLDPPAPGCGPTDPTVFNFLPCYHTDSGVDVSSTCQAATGKESGCFDSIFNNEANCK